MSERRLLGTQIQRHDTSSNWETKNPILKDGEIGIDSDIGDFKIGDGSSNWNDLGFLKEGIRSIIDSNSNSNFYFWTGTQEEYLLIPEKNPNTIYIIR